MKNYKRVLVILLTVILVLPLFTVTVSANSQWNTMRRNNTEQIYNEYYGYDALAAYLSSLMNSEPITTNENNNSNTTSSPTETGETAPANYEDTYAYNRGKNNRRKLYY